MSRPCRVLLRQGAELLEGLVPLFASLKQLLTSDTSFEACVALLHFHILHERGERASSEGG